MVVSRQKPVRARIASLNTAAQQLNSNGGVSTPFSLAFLTDCKRIPNPEIILRLLPKGVAVVLRDYKMPKRAAYARRLKSICHTRGLKLIVGGDIALARTIKADGIHIPTWFAPNNSDFNDLIVTASCHSAKELVRAGQFGADIAFLSPAFPTESHPRTTHLGSAHFQRMAVGSPIPILGLGGIDAYNAGKIAGPNVAGFGAIGAFDV